MALSHSPKVVTDGLAQYLDAANQKSYPGAGTTWSNLINSNYSTEISGATYSSDNLGSFVFDGVNDYASVSSSLSLSNQLTVSVWFKVISSNSNYQGIIGDWNTTGNTRSWLLTKINNATRNYSFFVNATGQSANNVSITSTTNFTLNQIYNLVGRYDGTTIKIFVDGVEEASTAYSSSLFQGNLFQLGTFSTTFYSNVQIYSSAVYTTALSSNEIKQNYDSLKSRYV